MPESPSEVTQLLHEWSHGDSAALERLIPLVFDDLRQIAGWCLRKEGQGHTLQPTALVSEVYLRLVGQRKIQWQNREQFFGIAALLMRRILVDYAKGRQAAKRGGGVVKVPLDEAIDFLPEANGVDLVALDAALSRLAEIDPRQSRIVELRFFMGLSHEEIAEILEISVTTVKREWKTARLWLFRELSQK
jgi:RNA polymerase sigma-70 factor (ECF subfamily)